MKLLSLTTAQAKILVKYNQTIGECSTAGDSTLPTKLRFIYIHNLHLGIVYIHNKHYKNHRSVMLGHVLSTSLLDTCLLSFISKTERNTYLSRILKTQTQKFRSRMIPDEFYVPFVLQALWKYQLAGIKEIQLFSSKILVYTSLLS